MSQHPIENSKLGMCRDLVDGLIDGRKIAGFSGPHMMEQTPALPSTTPLEYLLFFP